MRVVPSTPSRGERETLNGLGLGEERAHDVAHLFFEVRLVQPPSLVEAVHGVTDLDLAFRDPRAHRAEHLSELGLSPDCSEHAGAGLLRITLVAYGRDNQSSAFLSAPGIDELYSGVAKKTASTFRTASRIRRTASGAWSVS